MKYISIDLYYILNLNNSISIIYNNNKYIINIKHNSYIRFINLIVKNIITIIRNISK